MTQTPTTMRYPYKSLTKEENYGWSWEVEMYYEEK